MLQKGRQGVPVPLQALWQAQVGLCGQKEQSRVLDKGLQCKGVTRSSKF